MSKCGLGNARPGYRWKYCATAGPTCCASPTICKVPPTSNQTERDLRPAKIQQNISGRLTSEKRTKDRYRIRGYLSTTAKYGHNVMDALRVMDALCEAILGSGREVS